MNQKPSFKRCGFHNGVFVAFMSNRDPQESMDGSNG